MIGRTTRPRRRDTIRPRSVVTGGLATLIAVGVLVMIGLRAPGGVEFRNYRALQVALYDSGNLQPRSEVRIKGVRVGQVIEVRPRDGRAIAELKLDPGTEELPTDTAALLRARGLLGARYIDLIPGRATSMLDDGALIRARPDALYSGVPETLETFDAQTRAGLGRTLRGLGTGLVGRGEDLNATLLAGPRPANQFPDLIQTVLERPGAVDRLAPALRDGTAELDASREAIARGFGPAADALTPFAKRRDALGETIEVAPSTLVAARGGLDRGRNLVAAAADLARTATVALEPAPAALRKTSALLAESRRPLQRTSALLDAVRPAVPRTLTLLRKVSPLLAPLTTAFDDLDPLVRTLGTYGCEIDNFAENWRSALGFGSEQSTGGAELPSGKVGALHNFRILVVAGPQAISGVELGTKGLANVTPYPEPCSYAPGKPYPLFVVDSQARRAAR